MPYDSMPDSVSLIRRVDTTGGLLPADKPCDAQHIGDQERVGYSATYRFYATKECKLRGRRMVTGNFALSTPVRKNHAEYSAAARDSAFAANVNAALMLLYDIRRDPQTKARALRAFRGKERLVDMRSGFTAHAFARVRYGHPNAMLTRPPVGTRPHPNFESAPFGHRVNSIADQIDKDLANFAWEAHKFRGVVRR